MYPDIAIDELAIGPSATTPANLVVSFKVTAGGNPFTGLTAINGAYRYDGDIRDNLTSTTADFEGDVARTVTLAAVSGSDNAGRYTITIVDGETLFGGVDAAGRFLFRIQNATGGSGNRALVTVDYPSSPDDALVSMAGCSNCHGVGGNGGFHYGYPANGATCTVCHDATNTDYPRLFDIGHGIHASHIMPSGEYVLLDKDGLPVTDDGVPLEPFSATYPTYLTNCSVCHTSDSGALAKANDMAVTTKNCFSCHESMESWDFSGATFHEEFTAADDCTQCHAAGEVADELATVRAFHDGLETERVGIIYGGEDLSVTEGAKFNWTITDVVDDKASGKLTITWTAEFPKGTPINPCNTTASPTAPVFFPYGPNTAGEGTLSMLRSYAQGDDYVLGQANGPGQAAAVNLSTTNTTCASNVATTIIDRDNMPDGTRGIVALQGKPQLPVPAGMTTEHWAEPLMFVRVPTPTYEFVVGTGDPATPRRVVADTQDCLGCHVGSL
ncbi:MAG TPA: hypothetical protein VFO62_05115, partial [Candidatus Binatia bacterium]|nr:hypothetical protein [Candidatus Binatia bacterium]